MKRNPSDWQKYIDDLEARLEEAEHRLDKLKAAREELAIGIVENDPTAITQANKLDSEIAAAEQLGHNLVQATLQAERERERSIVAEEQEEKTRKAKRIEEFATALEKSAANLDKALMQLTGALESWLSVNNGLGQWDVVHDHRIDFRLAAWRAFTDGEITDHRILPQLITNGGVAPSAYRRASESPAIEKLRAQAAKLRAE